MHQLRDETTQTVEQLAWNGMEWNGRKDPTGHADMRTTTMVESNNWHGMEWTIRYSGGDRTHEIKSVESN